MAQKCFMSFWLEGKKVCFDCGLHLGLIWEREEEMKQELHILPTEEGRKMNNGMNAGGGGAKGTQSLPSRPTSTTGGGGVPEALSSSSSSANKDNKKVAGKVKNEISTHASSEVAKVQPLPQSGIQALREQTVDHVGKETSTAIKVGEETLAEELGAPGEDIENLLVEEPNNETQKKENAVVTPVIASAVVIQTDNLDKANSEQTTPVEKTSSSKKQRNYRQRSKSHSIENKKKRDSSPLKLSGKADKSETKKESSKKDVKSAAEKQKKHISSRRSSEKSRERRNRSATPEDKKRRSAASKDTKEKAVVVKRARPSDKSRPLPKSRKSDSVEKVEQSTARKEKRRDSSSSSGSSSDDEKHRKKPVSVKQSKDQAAENAVAKESKSEELRKTEKTVDTSSYDSTFGSELKKVKHLTKDAPAKAEPNILLPPVKMSEKVERKKVEEDKIVSTVTAEVPKPPVVAATPAPLEPPKIAVSDMNTPKTDIQVPTHSPLKSTKMFKEINPSLLPVDHENLTFKITSAFESAPTPPVLAPLPKTAPLAVANELQTATAGVLLTERPVVGALSRKSVETEEVRPETSDFYPSTVNQTTAALERNANANALHQESVSQKVVVAKSETTNNQAAAIGVASVKPDLSKKRRSRSPSTSSSSSSENEEVSPERKERKSRRSPPSGRKRRRNTSHKRKRSRSRRRHRPTSPRRKSSSRRRRRRTSRERRRAGGSRRRRSPAGERRRRRSPTTSSSGSSSSGSESSSGSSSGSKP